MLAGLHLRRIGSFGEDASAGREQTAFPVFLEKCVVTCERSPLQRHAEPSPTERYVAAVTDKPRFASLSAL